MSSLDEPNEGLDSTTSFDGKNEDIELLMKGDNVPTKIFDASDVQKIEIGGSPCVVYCSPGFRRSCDDRAYVGYNSMTGEVVFSVADGYLQKGGVFADVFMQNVKKERTAIPPEPYKESIENTVHQTQRAIQEIIAKIKKSTKLTTEDIRKKIEKLKCSGCCFVHTKLRLNNDGTWDVDASNAGDSQLLIIHRDRKIKRTIPHNLASIDPTIGDRAFYHHQRNVLYRSINDEDTCTFDQYRMKVSPGDWVFMFSDSIANLTPRELEYLTDMCDTPLEAMEVIMTATYEHMSKYTEWMCDPKTRQHELRYRVRKGCFRDGLKVVPSPDNVALIIWQVPPATEDTQQV